MLYVADSTVTDRQTYKLSTVITPAVHAHQGLSIRCIHELLKVHDPITQAIFFSLPGMELYVMNQL